MWALRMNLTILENFCKKAFSGSAHFANLWYHVNEEVAK